MIDATEKKLKDIVSDYEQSLYDRRMILKKHLDDGEVIGILKARFETELPCFQGKPGAYDPMDAMRRDAQREVVLWLETELKLAHEYSKITQ